MCSLYLAFHDFAFFKHFFYRKRRFLKRVPCLFVFVIRENEILISVIRDSLFFLCVNLARDQPLPPLALALWWARNNFDLIFSFVYMVFALFTFLVLVAYGGPRAVDKTRNMEHPGTFRNMKKLKCFFMKK